jgi:hypothetical protein
MLSERQRYDPVLALVVRMLSDLGRNDCAVEVVVRCGGGAGIQADYLLTLLSMPKIDVSSIDKIVDRSSDVLRRLPIEDRDSLQAIFGVTLLRVVEQFDSADSRRIKCSRLAIDALRKSSRRSILVAAAERQSNVLEAVAARLTKEFVG